ncbi:MAG: hypothetical protein SFU56_08095, partial [Capsulimonadales bacterium]|nr:hypothetical protein [Capsulimonadales bacterium]
PYNANRLDQVPSDAEGRREMVAKRIRARGEYLRSQVDGVPLLGTVSANTRYVEAFRICEYGSRPNDDELRDLFPLA